MDTLQEYAKRVMQAQNLSEDENIQKYLLSTWCQSLNCELMFDKEQGDAQKTGTCGTFLSNSITAQFRRELWQCC